jgi:two-component system phosphate regulon sensor histidine kinase PhoR
MPLSLRGRLLAAHAVLIVAALAIMTVLAAREQRRWLIERQEAGLEQVALRAATAVTPVVASDPARAPALADSLGAALGVRVTLMDAAGRVRGDSEVARGALAGVENHATRPEMRAALAGRAGRAVRSSHTVGRDLIYVAVPLRGAGDLAVLRLAEPLALVEALEGALLRQSLVAAAVALLISVLIAWRVAGGQARRARDLEQAAHGIGSGDATARARELPADELGRIGQAINSMAAELQRRLQTSASASSPT